MTHFFRRVCQAGLLIMFFPVAYAQQVAPSPDHLQLYRSRDCAQLKGSGAELEGVFKRSEAQWNKPGLPNLSDDVRAYEQQLRREGLAELDKKKAAAFAALAMATAEKQCDNPASGAASSPARNPVVEAAGGVPDNGPGGDLGYYRHQDCPGLVRIQQALQADAPRNRNPDHPAVFGHHIGVIAKYFAAKGCGNAAVNHASGAPVALPAISAAPPVQQAAMPAALAPDRALPAIPPPAGPPRFCYAVLAQIGKPEGVQSSLWEERGPDFSHAAMLRSMAGFVVHVRQVQPGIWHDDIPAGKCYAGTMHHCTASALRHFGTSQQINQFCHGTREQAEGARKRQGMGLPVIEWAPPAAP
jgi:hypothetical protein